MSLAVAIMGCRPNVTGIYKLTPCYEEAPSSCEDYSDFCGTTPPAVYTLLFTGISPLTTCQACGNSWGEYAWKFLWAPETNVVIRCPVMPWGCEWYGEQASNGSLITRLGNDCSGEEGAYANSPLLKAGITHQGSKGLVTLVWRASESLYNVVEVRLFASWFTADASHSHCASRFTLLNANPSGPCDRNIAMFSMGGATGGLCIVYRGDVTNPAASCPGGDPIYTDTDLRDDVGKVVKLNDNVWYAVSVETGGHPSDGAVSVIARGASCTAVC